MHAIQMETFQKKLWRKKSQKPATVKSTFFLQCFQYGNTNNHALETESILER